MWPTLSPKFLRAANGPDQLECLIRPYSELLQRPWYCTNVFIDAGGIEHPDDGATVSLSGVPAA